MAGLLLAQLWAALFGAWHRVAHAWPEPLNPPAVVGQGAAQPSPLGSLSEPASPEDATGHHAGDADCRLLDQLLLADAAGWPALPPAVAPVAEPVPQHPALAWHPAAAGAPYQARAPPHLS